MELTFRVGFSMKLTDQAVKRIKPDATAQKLSDGGGLFVLVTAQGSKLWRLAYRFGGKQKTLALGKYPEVTLAMARERREEARRLLATGVDPSELKKASKTQQATRSANSFEAVAREWFAKHATGWADTHSSKIMGRLDRDVFPWLGGKPIAEIGAPDVLTVLRRIEARGVVETAHRVAMHIGQVFRYAVATGRADRNPVADLKGALPPRRSEHFASLTDPKAVGELLRSLDAFSGTFPVQCALRLAPLLFVRPGELRAARWADIDLEAKEWRYVTPKTKTPHLVPLAPQAVAILRELQPLTGHRVHVFPGGRDPKRAMSEAAINAALRRLGVDTKTQMTGHGFRATARTLLHEVLNFAPEVIEHQLAHRVPDALGAAYNRTKFLPERVRMMTAWADYLDTLKAD